MKRLARFRKAAALPFVLLLVALNVIVVVALLVYATTELQASRNSGQTEVARAIAQSGIDIAAGLIAANSTNNGFVSYQRVTNVGGDWRLETKIGNVVATNPAMPWKTTLVTNPSVLHSGFLAGTDGVDLNFAVRGDPSSGFIAPRSNITTNWTNLSTNMFRMDWIYVYKGPTNDPKNLVGRVAYWVDDESSKLNMNYSGDRWAYTNAAAPQGSDYGKWTDFSIKRPNLTNNLSQKNFAGRRWPVYIDLGGVAGINANEAIAILEMRGEPNPTNPTSFPSVLAMRIATNSILTTLAQQSSLGFTATIYSKEDERSYATGKRRYDLLNIYPATNYPGAPTNTINEVLQAISDNYPGTNNYPSFNSKYDMNSFAANLYTAVQHPGLDNNAKGLEPARLMPSSAIYTRALPLVNEVTLRVEVANNSWAGTNVVPPGTNTISFYTDVELIVLSTVQTSTDYRYWGGTLTNAPKFRAEVELPTNSVFSTVFTGQFTNTIAISPPSTNWFKSPVYDTNGNFSYFTNGAAIGPTNSTLSSSNALTLLSATNALTDYNTNTVWSYPTNVTVRMYFNNVLYQSVSFAPAATTDTAYAPITNTTNTIYHMVAQPRGDSGFRGDPRFWTYTTNFFTNSAVSGPMTNSTNNPDASLGKLNPNWNISGYTNASSSPDLTPPDLFFYEQDRGIPQYAADKAWGFGPSLSGVGWLGEIPITTKPGSGDILTWSTPRFWGDGRPFVNGPTEYPPDWLLMDCFHMAAFPQVPQYSGSTNLVFSSFGKLNINSLKSFFQVARGSPNQSDTILDSVTVDAGTIDFRQGSGSGQSLRYPDWYKRTNFISCVANMVTNRNVTNNPYTTHFNFLADLATNTMKSPDQWRIWTGWWPAPTNATGDIYKATNTTDRRIEGIVRSLVHKLTTHGNQFSIFSLGQALQVVNGKTNVTGEAYMQAVYERAPQYNEATGAITNGATTGAPPMRQVYLRELRY